MIMLKKARLIDPASKLDGIRDILISDKKIMKIGEELEFVAPLMARAKGERLDIIDCSGLIAAPAFINTNIKLSKKEVNEDNLEKIWNEALRGGFSTLCLTSNKDNIVDNEEDILLLMKKSSKLRADIRTFASLSKEGKNNELVDMRLLRDAGAVAFDVEDKIIDNEKLLKEAMSTARRLKMPISFIKSNVENSLLKKLLNNIRDNNINIIIKDIKTRSDVEVLKEAREKNIKISAQVNPYIFYFDKIEVEDKQAVIEAIKEGLIDIISSDYDSFDMGDKKTFNLLEVGFSLGVMSLVDTGIMNISDFVSMLTLNVARFYGLEAGFIKEDKVANLVVFNPDKKWNYNDEFIYKNELYNKELKAKVVLNIVSGLVEYANI